MKILVLVAGTALPGAQIAVAGADSANAAGAKPASAAAPVVGINPVTAGRIINADREPGNWLTHGRTYSEQRYSPLNQINDQNVAGLGLAWHYDLDSNRGLEATPLALDGILYLTGNWNVVYAVHGKTGELLWRFDPEVDRSRAVHLCCDIVNRGVAAWGDKVYVGTLDGRLIAIDMATGTKVWDVLTVDLDWPYSITGAPRVANGKVFIGNGGAEMGVRGYVTAYDAETGAQVWRFYTIPGDPSKPFESPAMKMAAKTWPEGEWWTMGGGGTAWDSLVYEPEFNLLYIGVGNGGPWNQGIRAGGKGDNLFLSSIVAVNADTGEYVWHYQTTPGDAWDYTATQQIMLADLEIDGKTRKVLMQAPKNGFFYVLDRKTGELLSAEPYVNVTWATHIDMSTGRPAERQGIRYYERGVPSFQLPFAFGAHDWPPMSFSPQTGLVYIPAMEVPMAYFPDREFEYQRGFWNLGALILDDPPSLQDEKEAERFIRTIFELEKNMTPQTLQTMATILAKLEDPAQSIDLGDLMAVQQILRKLVRARLVAWDPVRQEEVWRVDRVDVWNSGTLATAGNLVFQGTGSARFSAYAADTGKELWSSPSTQTGIIAGPITYTVDGEQYVAVLAGWGGGGPLTLGQVANLSGTNSWRRGNLNRLVAFKLNGKDSLPPLRPLRPVPEARPSMAGLSSALIRSGENLYARNCAFCHGEQVMGGGATPDLRHLDLVRYEPGQWYGIVIGGTAAHKGMPNFSGKLGVDDADALRAYIIKRTHDEPAAARAAAGGQVPAGMGGQR
jgi:PQQ-dependent dehydrogenase (methanol/ethanol family)